MLITSSFSELMNAKKAIDELKVSKPIIYQKFVNIIQLTRQLQFRSQYMGDLIMGETLSNHRPVVQDNYVLKVYMKEVEALKSEDHIADLKQLLVAYKEIGYANISKLVLGKSPSVLVGPRIAR